MKKKDAIGYLVSQAREFDVRFIRIWFTDILGSLKSFAITIDQLESAIEEGVGIDGSSIQSFAREAEHDMVAKPDIQTFQLLPWRPRENAVARLFADIHHMDGSPYAGDPRLCLKRQLKKAADLGYTFYVGPEIEYFYFRTPQKPEPMDEGGYFDMTPLDTGSDLRRDTVLTLEEMGIAVHASHHEVAPSQHEINLRHMDAMTMADNTMTYRLAVKEVAMKQGIHATFMPKPIEGQPGSGMHIHQSLFHASKSKSRKTGAETNAFYDAKDKWHLSRIAKCYIAGLLKHAREMAIVTNQWVNSYKRLVSGYEAPTAVVWGQNNRSALVRIPVHKKGKDHAVRAEFRSPDPACNPYLVYSVMLAAGLRGIQKNYKLGRPIEESDKGIEQLPKNLGEAIEAAENSEFLKQALGNDLFNNLIANKKIEWAKYNSHVSSFELKKDLSTL